MDETIANSDLHFSGPVASSSPASTIIRPGIWRLPISILPISLPLASSRNGNLFEDRNDATLHWYLPAFALSPDVDPSFIFSASQESQLADGSPANVARLVLSVIQSMPADVTQFAQANPGAKLQPIPLENLSAVLSSQFTDDTGQQQTSTFLATSVTDEGNGTFQVLFDNSIMGISVVAVYQDLRVFGKAAVTLSATFRAWSNPGAPTPPGYLRAGVFPIRVLAATAAPAPAAQHAAPVLPEARFVPVDFRPIRPVVPIQQPIQPAPPQPPPPPSPPQLVEVSLPFSQALNLGLKYNLDGYQLRFTVATLSAASRVIISVSDLSSFNAPQTQYSELKELGDINAGYPSISRAYLGSLNRSIVLIPQRYSIVRNKAGCAVSCMARVDSSAASTSQCAFDFTFVIAPEINNIELAKFQNELLGNTDLNGYQTTFPSLLRDTPASTLNTSFPSSVVYVAGSEPHTFSITATVQDNGPAAPAVANANLLILQLCTQTGADLVGSLSLKLDDGFTDPVLATIDLNFAQTAGSNELATNLDPTVPAMNLSNLSPLDLQIQEYALVQGNTLTEVQGAFVLPAQSVTALPISSATAGISVIVAAQLALPNPLTISNAQNYLNIETVDVQATQFLIGLDASGVDFTKVATLAASVTFPSLPSIAPLQFSLQANLKSGSQHVLIPLINAMSTMPGTVALSVTFVDPSINGIQFSITNDFVTEPVLTLLQNQITAQMPTTG